MNIVLSPHLDDAVLSLGGLLAKEGGQSIVATCFTGAPEAPFVSRWDKQCGFADSTHAIRTRVRENEAALSRLGVPADAARNYNYWETEYRPSGEPNLQEQVARDILSLIQSAVGQPIKIYAPGLESHPDHALVKHAALDAAQAAPYGAAEWYLYQDIPYVFKVGDYTALKETIARGASVETHPIPLSPADMDTKLAAVALYTSQVPHLGADLLQRIKQFATTQARFHATTTPYCEVVYKLTNV